MVRDLKEKTIEISLTKALAVFSSAIIVSIVGAVFTTVRIINSDHYTLVRLSERVESIEANYVQQTIWESGLRHIDTEFEKLNKRFDKLEDRLYK